MPTSLAGEFVSCLKAGTRSRQTGLRSTLSSRFPLGWVAVSHVLHCSPSEDRQIDATVTARKPLLVCGGVCSGSLLREDPGDARNCHEQVAQAATRAGSARRPGAMERGRAPGAAAARLLARKRRAFQRKPLVGSGRAWHRPRPSRHRCLQRLLVRACCCPVEPKERANQRSVGRGLGVLRPAFELRGRLARELGCRSFQRGAQGFPLARGEVPELRSSSSMSTPRICSRSATMSGVMGASLATTVPMRSTLRKRRRNDRNSHSGFLLLSQRAAPSRHGSFLRDPPAFTSWRRVAPSRCFKSL
jgi:hypothetical protein